MSQSQNVPQTPDADLDEFLDGSLAKTIGLGDAELNAALAMANAKLQAGNGQQALSAYAMLVMCRPRDVEFQCGLANCALQVQEYEVALQAASAVIASAPRDGRGYYFSAAACLSLGHLNEAREDIADALRLSEAAPKSDVYAASQKLSAFLEMNPR